MKMPNTPNPAPEALTYKGHVRIETLNEDNTVNVLADIDNALTNAFRAAVADRIAGVNALQVPNYIAVGTGVAAGYDTVTDTAEESLDDGDNIELAQGFQVPANYSISHVLMRLSRVGTSNGNLTVEIQPSSGGLPTGTAIANGVSDAVPINSLDLTNDWILFEFTGTLPDVSTATQYHLVLKADVDYNYLVGVEAVKWHADNDSPSYADGQLASYDGSTWSNIGGKDAVFRIIPQTSAQFTTILGELVRKQLSARAVTGTASARLLANFGINEALDYIGHVGLYPAATGGNVHAIATVKFRKLAAQINVYWTITVQTIT